MSIIRQKERIKYFIEYAGSCPHIWNSIFDQKIALHDLGPGTIIGKSQNGNRLYLEVLFCAARRPIKLDLFTIFDDLTLPKEFEKDFEIRYQNIKKDALLKQLRKLASQTLIDQSTVNTFDERYKQLMTIHQTRNFSEQTIQEMQKLMEDLKTRYRNTLLKQLRKSEQTIQEMKKLMDRMQKLIDRARFSDLSAKAMDLKIRSEYPPPEPNERDIQLVGQWCQPPQNDLNRTSLIETKKKDYHLGRLLSARCAEKVAVNFYHHYGKKVNDISITQIDENSESDWRNYDLSVDGLPVDVKNSRRSQKSPNSYSEYYIQKKFRRSNEDHGVTISGILSPYLWPREFVNPTGYDPPYPIFLGETTRNKLQILKNEFNNKINFTESNSEGEFLPPWVFDYPEYVYTKRDQTLNELKNFTNLDSIKEATFEFNLIPVSIAAGIELTEILGNDALNGWEQNFLNQLRNLIKKYGLSLPFLFLTILVHFLGMAASSNAVSNFKPDGYTRFLFCKEKEPDTKPLGIYDPLRTIDALIDALSTLWTAENRLIRNFRVFKLRNFNILQGKSNPNERLWTTLTAYCGGRLEDGSACGKNPLVLGESEPCRECGRLRCPDCGFCSETCG